MTGGSKKTMSFITTVFTKTAYWWPSSKPSSKTAWGLPTGSHLRKKKLLVTRAQDNVVLEINHRRADEAYGELIGVPPL